MDLLERYLQAVRFALPRDGQDDIVRELSDDLLAQMEAREEDLGRALTDDERAEILRRHGHPLVVAGRYRAHQHLIGPAFFPIYVSALKAGLGLLLLGTVALALLTPPLSDDPRARLVEILWALPWRGLIVFALMTLAFAALDLWQSRLTLPAWDPHHLPPVVRPERQMSRLESMCELLLSSFCMVMVLLLPGRPFLVMGRFAARFLEPTPIWSPLHLPIALFTAAAVVLSAMNVVRPFWTPARSIARLAHHVGTVLVFLVLFWSGEWVTAKAGATLPNGESLEGIVHLINVSLRVGLAVAIFVSLVGIAWEIRSMRSRLTRASTEAVCL